MTTTPDVDAALEEFGRYFNEDKLGLIDLPTLGHFNRALTDALDELRPHLHAAMVDARNGGATWDAITRASGYTSLAAVRRTVIAGQERRREESAA